MNHVTFSKKHISKLMDVYHGMWSIVSLVSNMDPVTFSEKIRDICQWMESILGAFSRMQLSFVVKSRNTYLTCQSFSYRNYIVVFTGFIFSFLLIGPFTSRSYWKIDNDKCLGLDLARYVNQLVGQTISLYKLEHQKRSIITILRQT